MYAVEAKKVSKLFRIYHEKHDTLKEAVLFRRRARFEELWAVKNVSFGVPAGQTIGIIGENGSGKSTLLKMFAGILKPESGEVAVTGKMSALLELGAGFHPDLTGRENIYLNGAILRLSRKQIDAVFDDIVAFAELEEFIDQPVKSYSSGMYTRLGFAVAINVDPDVLLIDEVLAVGDQSFQNKCYEKIAQFQKAGKTIVFVSHDLNSIQKICDRALFMEKGHVADDGDPPQVIGKYLAEISAKDSAGYNAKFTSVDPDRVGTGEAEITEVEMLDDTGKKVTQVASGDKTTIRIHVRFHADVMDPVFGVSIRAADDTYLYDTNNLWRGVKSGLFKKNQQLNIDFKQDMTLLGGEYRISAAVAYPDITKFCDLRNYVLSFSITDERRDRGLSDLKSEVMVTDSEQDKIIFRY